MTQEHKASTNGNRDNHSPNSGVSEGVPVAPRMTLTKLIQALVANTLLIAGACLVAYLIMGEKFHDVIGGPLAHTRNVFIFLGSTFIIVINIALILTYAKSKSQTN